MYPYKIHRHSFSRLASAFKSSLGYGLSDVKKFDIVDSNLFDIRF